MTRSGCVVIFVGVVLALGASFGARAASCGEASCVPAQGAYVSHFTGPGCTGTESYYQPYNNYGYSCRSWDGGGVCGTIRRTVTNRSYKYNGTCYEAWPSGNTLSDFVTIYRGTSSPSIGSLRVLTFNTHLLSDISGFSNAPCLSGRGRLIGRMLAQGTGDQDYDVVMFQEVFNDGAKDRIVEEAGSKYPHKIFKQPPAKYLHRSTPDQNGGTAIMSKYRFLPVASLFGLKIFPVDHYAEAWEECDNNVRIGPFNAFGDCNSQKGWVHTRIDFHGVPVNIISLHTQANYEDGRNDYTWTQQQQLLQLQDYLDSFPRSGFFADLSTELVILGGDYNVRGHCDTCFGGDDYFSVTGLMRRREAWREEHCFVGPRGFQWNWDLLGQAGHTSVGSRKRLDMIFYDDSASSGYELRPERTLVDTFYIGYAPPVSCEDDGDFSKPFEKPWASDHYGVATTFQVYPAASAPGENLDCGIVPEVAPVPSGNPFDYLSERDRYLACHGISLATASWCDGVREPNDRQLCRAMAQSSQGPCTTMSDRNLQLACYGMSIGWSSNCRSITDANMQSFCYAVSGRNVGQCDSLDIYGDTKRLCEAMSAMDEAFCEEISVSGERAFCHAVSAPDAADCAGIEVPPEACFNFSTDVGPAPLTVDFDAACSSDVDGQIISYSWDFDDGTTATGRSVRHTFYEPRSYSIRLTVVDDDGRSHQSLRGVVACQGSSCLP